MTNIVVKVDTREHNIELIEMIESFSYENGFEFEKTCLPVGDIQCGNVIIERKEAGDFIGSITSGRLSEQAKKISANFKNKYIIIEGNPYRTTSNIKPNAIIGMMSSLAVKYGMKLIFTDNSRDTAYVAISIFKKHIEYGDHNVIEPELNLYKMTDEDVVIAMLYQIPRLGTEKAKIIAEKYGYSIRRMCNEINYNSLIEIDGIGPIFAERITKLFS